MSEVTVDEFRTAAKVNASLGWVGEAEICYAHASELEAAAADEAYILELAKRIVEVEFDGYNQWHDLPAAEQEKRVGYVRTVFEKLRADGRLVDPSEAVTHDDTTLERVYEGLAAAGVKHRQAVDAVNQMQNQGIAFRHWSAWDANEPAEATDNSELSVASDQRGRLYPHLWKVQLEGGARYYTDREDKARARVEWWRGRYPDREVTLTPPAEPAPVHNHGSEDGPGLAFRERQVDGRLRGECMDQPDGTPEKPWPTWQDVPEGIVYRRLAAPTGGSWINRGGIRYWSDTVRESTADDRAMDRLAPFVRVEREPDGDTEPAEPAEPESWDRCQDVPDGVKYTTPKFPLAQWWWQNHEGERRQHDTCGSSLCEYPVDVMADLAPFVRVDGDQQ